MIILKQMNLTNRVNDTQLNECKRIIKTHNDNVKRRTELYVKIQNIEFFIACIIIGIIIFNIATIIYGEMFTAWLPLICIGILTLSWLARSLMIYKKERSELKSSLDYETYEHCEITVKLEEFLRQYKDSYEILEEKYIINSSDKNMEIDITYASKENGDVFSKCKKFRINNVKKNCKIKIPSCDLRTGIIIIPTDKTGKIKITEV